MTETAITRLWQRLQSAIGRVRSTSIFDDSKSIQTLQVVSGPKQTRDLMRVAEFGLASCPPKGTDAITVSIAGDKTRTVIIGTNHQPSRLKGLQPGKSALYDDDGKRVWLKRDHIEVDGGGKPVRVVNASEVTVDAPVLKCTGDIIDNSGSNSVTLKQLRDAYDAHKHSGVSAGGASTGTTDHPL